MVQTPLSTFNSYYESTGFIRFFRIDELVQNTKLDVRHAIHVQNVSYSPLNNAIQMVLQHSKSGQIGNQPFNLSVIISVFVLCLLSGYIYM